MSVHNGHYRVLYIYEKESDINLPLSRFKCAFISSVLSIINVYGIVNLSPLD